VWINQALIRLRKKDGKKSIDSKRRKLDKRVDTVTG